MIKDLANIILIGIVLHSQLYNSFVVAGYEINYDYYVEELCENKEKPEMHCDGKCFFSKQLALDEDQQKDTEPPSLLPSLRQFTASEILNFPVQIIPDIPEVYPSFNQDLPRNIFLSLIEHPPRV